MISFSYIVAIAVLLIGAFSDIWANAHDDENEIVDPSLIAREVFDFTEEEEEEEHRSLRSCTATAEVTEGPYFSAGSPLKTDFTADLPNATAKKIQISGRVYDTNCNPLANAMLQFWHAQPDGSYDNSGYILRGHMFTDSNGKYSFKTYFPGKYVGRTLHIHLKVHVPGDAVTDSSAALTSQLFFPKVADNADDDIYQTGLLVKVRKTVNGVRTMRFNFVINT